MFSEGMAGPQMNKIKISLLALLCMAPVETPFVPYHVSGCLMHREHGEVVYDQLHVLEDVFATYEEAHEYIRLASLQYPTGQFALGRIVSYQIQPGGVRLGTPLTEADNLEWWVNGRVTLRTFPPSRRCGDAIAVRGGVVRRRCRD